MISFCSFSTQWDQVSTLEVAQADFLSPITLEECQRPVTLDVSAEDCLFSFLKMKYVHFDRTIFFLASLCACVCVHECVCVRTHTCVPVHVLAGCDLNNVSLP